MNDLYLSIAELCKKDIQKNRDLAKVLAAISAALTDMLLAFEETRPDGQEPKHTEYLKLIEDTISEELSRESK